VFVVPAIDAADGDQSFDFSNFDVDELIAHRFSDGSAVYATCSEFSYKGLKRWHRP
jgi:hypothetical protein